MLIATDNTVVAYTNKEGGTRSGPLCALLLQILTWWSRKQVTLEDQYIPSQLNVAADKLSRLGKIIKTEWSLVLDVFQLICTWWHQLQIDIFAKGSTCLPRFVAVDTLSLLWEDLDPYAFSPAAILGKVVSKLRDYSCRRIILIALCLGIDYLQVCARLSSVEYLVAPLLNGIKAIRSTSGHQVADPYLTSPVSVSGQ